MGESTVVQSLQKRATGAWNCQALSAQRWSNAADSKRNSITKLDILLPCEMQVSWKVRRHIKNQADISGGTGNWSARNKMGIADKLVFQARMIINPVLEEKLRHQRKAHLLIRWWVEGKLENLHRQLMNNKIFQPASMYFK